MDEESEEFRDGKTSLFRSLRGKKEKTSKKKKSGTSKSIFSSLLLANYEQQMQFDPSANYSNNFAIGNSREVLRANNKLRIGNRVTCNVMTEEEKSSVCDSSDSEILDIIQLNVNPEKISEIYEDVLCDILHHLDENTDTDLPVINKDLAFMYVRDAFGISENKHNEILEKVKAREPLVTLTVTNGKVEMSSLHINWEPLIGHCNLNKVLLVHELELSQTPEYYWSGKFSFLSSTILELHSKHSGLSDVDLAMSRWSAFADIHGQHQIDPKVFVELFDKVRVIFKESDEASLVPVDMMSSAKVFLPSCFGIPANLKTSLREQAYNKPARVISKNEQMIAMFWGGFETIKKRFLKFIETLSAECDLENVTVETLQNYAEILGKVKSIEKSEINIEESIKEAIKTGASRGFSRIVDRRKLRSKEAEVKLNELIRVVEVVMRNLTTISDPYGSVFKENFNFIFAKHLFEIYDTKFAEMIKPITLKITQNGNGKIVQSTDSEELQKVAQKLVQLYMRLKQFADKGMETMTLSDFKTREYSNWFNEDIDQWSKDSVFTALTRFQKSISEDNLKPINMKSKHSKSAVDASEILSSVRTFWENFTFPTDETISLPNYISTDICRLASMYFDQMGDKAESSEAMRHMGIFKVPLEVCVAANNINFVSHTAQKLIVELTQTQSQEDNLRLQKIICNALKHGNLTTLNLIKLSVNKMKPSIRKLLLEGADVVKAERDIGDRLLVYIDDALLTLSEDLSEKDYDISKVILWKAILDVFGDLIRKSLEVRRIPIFYSNLRTILNAVSEAFRDENNEFDHLDDKLLEIESLLERHCFNTPKVIQQYYIERYQMQQQISKSPFNPFGVLSVKCFFFGNILKLEILNAKNLVPFGGSRKCDSFVKINMIPEEAFPKLQNYKTRTETDTHFPLYDELFEIDLTSEQRSMKDAIIFFNIKDRVLMRSNQCLAEAFLSFDDIPEYSEAKHSDQIHLTLTRMQSDDMESLRILQVRSQSGDKPAKEFLTKVRSKMVDSLSKSRIPVTNL